MIIVLFDAAHKGLRPSLMSIQKDYQEIIHTSINAHMAEKTNLEIILVRGDSIRIRSLEQQLNTKRGVQSVRLTLISS